MKTKFFSAVLSAFMLATVSVGVTAYAEETASSSAVDMVETTTATSTTTANETDIPTETTTAETIPDFYGDPYYDTEGNASLIKSEKIIYNTEEMQFIAVTTKDGHVFYVLINYSAENGEDQVFFLNKVDDYDLYALLYAGEENEDGNAKFTPEQAAQAAEDVNGRVKPKTDSGSENTAETTESGEDTSEGDAKQAESAPMNKNSIYLIFGAIALIGVGAAGFMLKKKNGSKKSAVSEPEYDEETEIVEEDDEDMAFYDHNDDEE